MKIIVKNGNMVFQERGKIKRVLEENFVFNADVSRTHMVHLTRGNYLVVVEANSGTLSPTIIGEDASNVGNDFFATRVLDKVSLYFHVESEIDKKFLISANSSVNFSIYEVVEIDDYSDLYNFSTGVNAVILLDKTKTYKFEFVTMYEGANGMSLYGWESVAGSSSAKFNMPATMGNIGEVTVTGLEKVGIRTWAENTHVKYKITEVTI